MSFNETPIGGELASRGISLPINEDGMKGYGFPLSPNGDLHFNTAGEDHWTMRFRGSSTDGNSIKLTDNDLNRFVDNWRTHNTKLDFRDFDIK